MPHSNANSVSTLRKDRRWTRTQKKDLEIDKLTNILTLETNLQTSQISMADHSCRNSQRLKVVNYFCRKAPQQTFACAPNTPLYLIWLTYQKTCVSTKKMVSALAHKKSFKKQHIVKKMYKQKKQTYLPNTAYISNQIS